MYVCMYPVFWIKFYQGFKKKKGKKETTLELKWQDQPTHHSGFLKLTMFRF